MKRTKNHSTLSTHVLQGAFIYLAVFFILFFFTDFIGTNLNWPFWLIPPFYALYLSQLQASGSLLQKLLRQRLTTVIILSFIGMSFPYVSFAFIVLFSLESVFTVIKFIQIKSFAHSFWSLLLLLAPLLYIIFDRMYQAGLLNVIVFGIATVALGLYAILKRKGFFKRLFFPK